MKKTKFKKSKININYRWLIVIMSIFFIFYIFNKMTSFVSTNIKDYLIERVKKENILILRNSYNQLYQNDYDVKDFIKIVKNSKEEIIEVEFDIEQCSKILSSITGSINEALNNYNYLGYRIDIPLGILSKNPIFMNLGSKIPIKVEISDVALGNVKTTIKEFGINSALVEIYLDVYLNTSILYPLENYTESTTYSTLIASKIISGVVPSFYNGMISAESQPLTMPFDLEST